MEQLQHMFDLQQQLNERMIRQRGLSPSWDPAWIERYTLAMLSELAEVLDEVRFKWWKNNPPLNRDALQNELVDVFHFFLSMCLTAGMDAQTLYDKYLAKNNENHARQDGNSQREGYEAGKDPS